jgi:hypothetical protein
MSCPELTEFMTVSAEWATFSNADAPMTSDKPLRE